MLNRALIQFSCAANETNSDYLFAECLLKTITQKDTPVADIFRKITTDVYQKRYEPFLVEGLSQYGHIFLDQVINRTY